MPGENPCDEAGYGCLYFESFSFVLLDATTYAMAQNTHTERTVTPTSRPMVIAESTKINNIAAMTVRVLNSIGWSYGE